MADYYSRNLSAERLRRCYEIAPPRVQRYLEAEIEFVLERIEEHHVVLELGCGYGRVLRRLAGRAGTAMGIDTAMSSLRLAQELLGAGHPLFAMDAASLGFRDNVFDAVICVQNGIAAFNVDQRQLLREAARVARSGGIVLLSSYAADFWPHRLHWFRLQSEQGLVGVIDENETGNNVIVCRDGFRAAAVDARGFRQLAGHVGLQPEIVERDGSSLFLEIRIP